MGTNEAAFDRLLLHLDGIGNGEKVIVQHGASAIRPAGAKCVDFLLFDEMVATMRKARVVVTHAGVGSVMTALLAGKRPIVVPRLQRFSEAVDDHQLVFARRLQDAGMVTLVEELDELPEAVGRDSEALDVELRPDRRLVSELRDFVSETVRRSSVGVAGRR